MSDHALLALLTIVGFALWGVVLGVVAVELRLARRQVRRMTRLTAALIVQEADKLRALFGGRP